MDKHQADAPKDPIAELVDFIAGLRKARNLAIDDLPPYLAQIVGLYATQMDHLTFEVPPFCRRATSKLLEELRLQCFQELQTQTDDLHALIPAYVGLILVKLHDLAPGLGLLYKPKSLPEAIKLVTEPASLREACPDDTSPELLESLTQRIESLIDKQGQANTTARADLQTGREVLSQAVLNTYLAKHERLLSLEDLPGKQDTPPPQPPSPSEPDKLFPSLPGYYVATQKAEQVVEALVPTESDGESCYQVVVLHGGPGVGKTTLASAVAQEDNIRRFFADCILWVSFTHKPPQAVLRDVCHQIGLQPQTEESGEQLCQRFKAWAAEQTLPSLLIVDDVQTAEDLSALLPAGNQVRMLISCQNRRAVESAIWERWRPTAEEVLWLPISGLARREGQALVREWQVGTLPFEEERARERVGDLVHWHPMALWHYAAEARHIGWQDVEKLVQQGNHEPESPFFHATLNDSVQRSLSRLDEGSYHALLSLKGAFRSISTFGVGAAKVVWDEESHKVRTRLHSLEDHGLIEAVAHEPWPLQNLIQQTYREEERYRLMPILRQIACAPESDGRWYTPSGRPSRAWQRAISKKAELPPGPEQVRWQFWLAAWLVLLFTSLARIVAKVTIWLIPASRKRFTKWDTPELEERIQELWDRQGLLPPAEIWMALQKTQWSFHPFGHLYAALLLGYPIFTAIVACILRTLHLGRGICLVEPTLMIIYILLGFIFFRLSVQPQAWWIWLLGLYDQDFRELCWTRRLARRLGLKDPLNQALKFPDTVE